MIHGHEPSGENAASSAPIGCRRYIGAATEARPVIPLAKNGNGSASADLNFIHPTATLGLIANRTARNGPYRARLNAVLLECARWDSCIVACRFVAITTADPRIDQQDHVHRDSGCSVPDAVGKRVKTPSTAHCGWSRSVRNAKSAQEVLTKEQGQTIYKAKRSR
ncbi:hypothetical protein OH76DRAFT_1412077 [Lentinus brumalis]|uniref:Uncharacterized protein n=1 Tax=Lentinus brumalis TaxID=2498619 RepID=A0A371CMK1_9APHY|nr:hypothetical protein OH76DRAFT_1412077 [Polyporus brumalis]